MLRMSKMKTIVFIRGWASTEYSFRKFVQSKPPDWDLILIGADEIIQDNNIEKSVKMLDSLIKQNDLNSSFILAGHSLGGALAIAYAAKYSQKINKLYLINTVGAPLTGTFEKESIKMIWRNSKKLLKQIKTKIYEGINLLLKPVFHIKLGKFARGLDLLNEAAKIRVPTYILYGDEDQLVSRSITEQIFQKIPKAKLILLKAHDHDWIQTDPDLFWNIINKSSVDKGF